MNIRLFIVLLYLTVESSGTRLPLLPLRISLEINNKEVTGLEYKYNNGDELQIKCSSNYGSPFVYLTTPYKNNNTLYYDLKFLKTSVSYLDDGYSVICYVKYLNTKVSNYITVKLVMNRPQTKISLKINKKVVTGPEYKYNNTDYLEIECLSDPNYKFYVLSLYLLTPKIDHYTLFTRLDNNRIHEIILLSKRENGCSLTCGINYNKELIVTTTINLEMNEPPSTEKPSSTIARVTLSTNSNTVTTTPISYADSTANNAKCKCTNNVTASPWFWISLNCNIICLFGIIIYYLLKCEYIKITEGFVPSRFQAAFSSQSAMDDNLNIGQQTVPDKTTSHNDPTHDIQVLKSTNKKPEVTEINKKPNSKPECPKKPTLNYNSTYVNFESKNHKTAAKSAKAVNYISRPDNNKEGSYTEDTSTFLGNELNSTCSKFYPANTKSPEAINSKTKLEKLKASALPNNPYKDIDSMQVIYSNLTDAKETTNKTFVAKSPESTCTITKPSDVQYASLEFEKKLTNFKVKKENVNIPKSLESLEQNQEPTYVEIQKDV